jgi:NAD-dependent DNA ligase
MQIAEVQAKIQALSAELKEHNYRYYVLAEHSISDHQFDIKLKELEALEKQYQANLKQLEDAARQGHNVAPQLDGLHKEVLSRQQQLGEMQQQLAAQLAELEKVTNGTFLVTGQMENYVTIAVGDSLYEKLRKAEVHVQDGVVTAIVG